MARPYRHPSERFWEKVERRSADECWEWQGSRQPFGYGILYGGPLYRNGKRIVVAHRLSWEIAHGRLVPDGMDVLHRCDNPGCVNPAHLHLGTQADNNRERSARGRGRENRSENRGEKSPVSKLTDEQVREIRRQLAAGASQSALGRRFGVSQPTIWHIGRRNTWTHLPDD